MKQRLSLKITLILILMMVIGLSVTSCFMFFMDWSPEESEEYEYLIDEDFNDGIADNWTITDGTWATSAVEYILTTIAATPNCYGSYYNETANNSFTDYTFEANITQINTDTTLNKFGLFFRCTNPGSIILAAPTHSGYMLYIRMTNSVGGGPFWGLQIWDGLGGFTSLMPETFEPNLSDIHGTVNKVKVDVQGDKIDVYFNDVFIQTFYDSTYTYGSVGLFGWGGATANDFRFDDVRLWAVKE